MARKRGDKWMADVRLPDGQRLRPSFPTEARARAWEENALEAVAAGRDIPPARPPTTAPATKTTEDHPLSRLGTLCEHVCNTHWAGTRGERERTMRARKCADYFGKDKDVREITSAGISTFRADLASRGLSTATVNRHVTALSKLLRTAQEEGVLGKMPKFYITREEHTRFRYLDQQEEAKLLAYWRLNGDEVMADFATFLIDTGARCFSEALPVAWSAFGPDDQTVTFWVTKTGKPRTIPLTNRLKDIIAKRRKVVGGRAGPFWGVNEHTFKSRWSSMRGALGFHDVTPHTLRHTCCTRLVLGGVDVKRVMTWMGHSAIQTTLRYMQMRPSDLDSALEVLQNHK